MNTANIGDVMEIIADRVNSDMATDTMQYVADQVRLPSLGLMKSWLTDAPASLRAALNDDALSKKNAEALVELTVEMIAGVEDFDLRDLMNISVTAKSVASQMKPPKKIIAKMFEVAARELYYALDEAGEIESDDEY